MRLDYRQEPDRVCCHGCSLHPHYTGNLVWYTPTEIEGHPDIMVVAEAPGANEDAYVHPDGTRGRPLVGVSGQIHRACMQEAGILGDYALANVCKCRPQQNKIPTQEEVRHCLPYLLEEIQRHKPKVVVMLGGTAIQALAPEMLSQPGGVRRAQGRYVEKDGVTYLANVHPSFIARQHEPNAKAALTQRYTQVLQTAKKLVEEDPSVDWLKDGHYFYVDTLEKLKSVVDMYLTTPAVEGILAFDTETRGGLNRFKNEVSMLQFCNDGMVTALIPFMHPETPWKPEEIPQVKAEIVRLFTMPTSAFSWITGNYLKFDLAMLKTCIHPDLGTARLPIHGSLLDTMFLAHSVDEQRLKRISRNQGPMSLQTLAGDFIGWTKFEESGMKKKRSNFDKVSLADEDFRNYCAMDGYVPHRLAQALLQVSDKEEGGRERVLNFNLHLHGPLICTFESIERNGFQVDVPHLRTLCGELSPIKQRMKDIKEELFAIPEVKKANEIHLLKTKAAGLTGLFGAPWVLDIDKKDCLITLFMDVLELKPLKFSKPKINKVTGEEIQQPEINTAFFERYQTKDDLPEDEEVPVDQHIVSLIYEYKGLYKLDTSYTKSVNKRINEEGPDGECADGRVRCSFTSCRVTSGRTSSENPNLQQIPSAKGRLKATNAARKAVKNMYCVPQGRLLVQMDVATSEVRWAIQISDDKNYAKVFWQMEEIKKQFVENPTEENKKHVLFKCDPHKQTAALMNQLRIEDVTPLQRQEAKAIIFGILFGQHIKTLASNLGITVEEAERLLGIFYSQFGSLHNWLLAIEKEAQQKGYVTSPMGRRRHLSHAYSSGNQGEINRANRQARNSPIQAISSDYNLLAGIRLQEYIEKNDKDWKIVNLVHDSIITEIPYDADVLREYISTAESIFCDTSCLKEMFGIEMIVPLAVDFEIGFKYGDCKEFDRSEKEFEEIWRWLEQQVADGVAWPKQEGHVWN